MKEFYKSSELPHIWAHNTDTDRRGRCPGNESFHGDCYYSYGTVIGRKVRNNRGAVVGIVLNCTSYSHTTSGHLAGLRRAVTMGNAGVPAFYVRGYSRGADLWDVAKPAGLVNQLTAEAMATLDKPASRYAYKRAEQVSQAAAELRTAISAAEVLHVGAAKARRELAKLGDLSNAVELLKLREQKRAAAAEKQRLAREKKLAADRAEYIAGFLAGADTGYTPHGTPTLGRISGEELETTLGARVPLAHVRRALPVVLSLLAAGKAWRTNGHTIHLGEYRLDEITEAGDVVAGCHRFSKAEVYRIAGLVGVPVPVALPVDTAEKAELISNA